MSTSLMLQGKRAVVFGGGGSIGAAVARELASEGADVFLAGRTSTTVEAVSKQITAAGGCAHADVIASNRKATGRVAHRCGLGGRF